MSGQGQIDPVLALSQLQDGQAPGEIDPVHALAMGQAIPAPAQQAPQTSGWKGPAWADPAGVFSAGARNFLNGAAFNLGDPAMAAIGAAMPIQGYTSTKPTYGERFNELLDLSRGATAEGQKSHPLVSLGAAVAGGMANPVTRAVPAPSSLGAALLQGGGMGAAYSAGGSIGNSRSLGDAALQTGEGAGFGMLGGGISYGLGKALAGATRTPPAQLLHDEGVPLTPGESLGGTARTLEDASTHIPMMGNAINGRQADAITGFNRATYNRVLDPLGLEYAYPKDAPVGNEAIQRIGTIIGKAYDDAYEGATIKQTDNFSNAISQAVSDANETLPKDRAVQIAKNINTRLVSKFDAHGNLNTDDLIAAKNWFAEQSRAGPTASLDEKAIAKAYGGVVDAIKDGIGEVDPDKGALLNAADNSFMRYVKLSQAAGQNQASGRGGIFTPAQLGAAIRTTENSTRRMDFAKGVSPMQDLAQAGQQVLPSTVPDSGSAIRGLVEAAPWIGATALAKPEAAVLAGGALATGTALYTRPGQKLAEALLFGAPGARKAMAAIPRAMLPGVLAALQPVTAGSKP